MRPARGDETAELHSGLGHVGAGDNERARAARGGAQAGSLGAERGLWDYTEARRDECSSGAEQEF